MAPLADSVMRLASPSRVSMTQPTGDLRPAARRGSSTTSGWRAARCAAHRSSRSLAHRDARTRHRDEHRRLQRVQLGPASLSLSSGFRISTTPTNLQFVPRFGFEPPGNVRPHGVCSIAWVAYRSEISDAEHRYCAVQAGAWHSLRMVRAVVATSCTRLPSSEGARPVSSSPTVY